MPKQHTIRDGDSVSSLAEAHGHFARTIWDDPANAQLKQKRPDMNVLMPGDVVVVPDKRPKEVSKADKQRHRFRRKGVPSIFRVQLFDGEKPRANQKYRIIVDGAMLSGTTDADGVLEQFVPPGSREGRLIIGDDEAEFIFEFGTLQPQTEVSGVQRRLNNLGYYCGEPDGELNESTKGALAAFQRRMGLSVSGEIDQATTDKIAALHDNVDSFPEPPANS